MNIAQIIMLFTLFLMVSGKVPIYLTAVIGSTIAALAFGIPPSASFFGISLGEAEVTVGTLLQSGLHPVLIDMLGVLLFIGIMEKTGFLRIIILKIMDIGKNLGGGPGIAAAGGIAAGVIGGMTGFTQPAITGVVTGPASVKLGVDPNKSAGTHALAGILGNFGGFTHPTIVAVVATAGIGFGAINIVGILVGLSAFAMSFYRLSKDTKANKTVNTDEEISLNDENEEEVSGSFGKAVIPFLVLIVGFISGLPIVLNGIVASLFVVLLSGMKINEAEKTMMDGIHRIATPLFATVSFLFMSAVINQIGLVDLVSDVLEPVLNLAPIQIMLLVSAITGLVTQSNGASAAIVVPFLQVVIASGANPFVASLAAAGGPAIMQYFLTGGPVAALTTVIPVIPGSELKAANKFQRPDILFALGVLFVITLVLSFIM